MIRETGWSVGLLFISLRTSLNMTWCVNEYQDCIVNHGNCNLTATLNITGSINRELAGGKPEQHRSLL